SGAPCPRSDGYARASPRSACRSPPACARPLGRSRIGDAGSPPPSRLTWRARARRASPGPGSTATRSARWSTTERDNPALAIHQHGDFGVRQNLVRFAADHQSRYPAPAVGGHEDYVAAFFRRSLDNLLPRVVTDLVDHLAGDPGQFGSLLY